MDILKEVDLPNLESLQIREAKFDRDALAVFGRMQKLRKLSSSNPARALVVVLIHICTTI
jgi:hypothetical protein